jgi:cytidine deaminase
MSDFDALLDAARAARDRAYAPYSTYRVGAALRTRSGALYSGCNVENAAYPEGTCAEAGAIAAMVNDGEREIVEVVVIGAPGRPCTPCGGCRQKLREFAAAQVVVHVCDPDGEVLRTTVGALLPHDFGCDNIQSRAPDEAGNREVMPGDGSGCLT